MDKEVFHFLNHPESKFEGNIGLLKRRHLKPASIVYMGKESNKIEMDLISEQRIEKYVNEDVLRKKILEMTPKEAKNKGVSRPTLWKIKRNIERGKKINWKTKSIRKLS